MFGHDRCCFGESAVTPPLADHQTRPWRAQGGTDRGRCTDALDGERAVDDGLNEDSALVHTRAASRYVARLGVDIPGGLASIRMTAFIGCRGSMHHACSGSRWRERQRSPYRRESTADARGAMAVAS